MLWPAVARRLHRELRAGAHEAHGAGCARCSSASTLARRPVDLPELEPRSPAAHDRRHRHPAARDLRRAALRGRLLPRRQRARAPADDALEDAGSDEHADRCARWRRATSPSCSHAFNRETGRFRNFMSYCAPLDRGRAAPRTATAARCGRSAPWSAARAIRAGSSLAGQLFHAALPALAGVHEPARLGLRAARHRRVPARASRATATSRACAAALAERLLDLYQRTSHAGLALVRGAASPTATRACRRRCSSRGPTWATRR